jgi:ADP-ribose pyrophosphatase
MQTWKTLSRRLVLDQSPYLVVEEHTVALPDGRVIDDWPWLIMPDFAIVVAVTQGGDFLCFRQVKYGVGGETLALVGGYVEPSEDPLATARRELLEETGYDAPDWQSLGAYRVDGNRGGGTAYLFLAQGARRTAEPDADDLEEQELMTLSRSEIEHALALGEFKVLAWPAALALALLRLKR